MTWPPDERCRVVRLCVVSLGAVKLVGAVLFVAATTSIGFAEARRVADKVQFLEEVDSALGVLGTEIGYCGTPLAQALVRAADSSRGFAGTMMQKSAAALSDSAGSTACEVFRQALQEVRDMGLIDDMPFSILWAFSSGLGASNRNDQMRLLQATREKLRLEAARAREQQIRESKLYRYLGLLGGVAVVLALY